MELDKNVMSLVETMNDTFALVQKHNNLYQSKSQIVLRMVQQTTECGWFISDYTKIEQFCQCFVISWSLYT